MKILILTSSFEGTLPADLSKKYTIFSTNWGICHGVPIDYYFCSIAEPSLINEINKRSNLIKNWMITDNVKSSLNIDLPKGSVNNLFNFLQNIDFLGKKHIRPKQERNTLHLPTSGVQMIYAAASYKPTELLIKGINLYSTKNSNGGYKIYGNTFLENPYLMKNKPHNLYTDLLFIYSSFGNLVRLNSLITCDSEILNEILKNVRNGVPLKACYSQILKKFY